MLRASMGNDEVDIRSDSRLSLGAKHFVFILSLSFLISPNDMVLEALSPASVEETQ